MTTTLLSPTTTSTRPAPSPPQTIARAASPTIGTVPEPPATTKPDLSAAEANFKLCGQIEYADQAVTAGNFVAGGLRLAAGISSYGDIADAGLVQLTRQMLSTGKAGDADGYTAARSGAAALCAQLGRPIAVGGIQCVTTPCP
ncbi:MAG: hypothetical protein ACRD0Q_11720 [Acidimicrobiales bacterium]